MIRVGKLVAYVGAMGAGKTKKLIELFEEMSGEGMKVKVFKPFIGREDEDDDKVYARNGKTAPATMVDYLMEVAEIAQEEELDAILIDEIQFFEDDEPEKILEGMAMAGLEVYVFGLDVTSENETFGAVGDILAHADEVHKLHATCYVCGEDARISKFMKGEKTEDIQVGDLGDYEPHCRSCYYGFEDHLRKLANTAIVTLSGKGFYFSAELDKQKLLEAGYDQNTLLEVNNLSDVLKLIEQMQKTE